MGQKIATLEVGLEMATGSAVAELSRFGGAVDKVSAQAIRDLDRIDEAMHSVGGLDAATASVVKMAEATARSAIEMAREADRSERAGERIVAQIERQASVYGLSRSEVRALRAEEAARAADANNQHELATRIRAAEAQLYDLEFAAARKAQQAANAAAEDAAIAAERAVQTKEREAQAVREASHAYQMFEARVREGAAAMREAAAAAEQQERRTAAFGVDRFEAYAKQKMGEYRGQQAAEAAADAERAAAALRAEASAADAAARAHSVLASAVQGSHAAQVADAEAAERLRMATDPLYAATARLNAEIAESTRLYHAGATAPAEYARQQEVLATRLRAVGQSHVETDQIMRRGTGTLTQFSFQLNDIATMAAMGAPPMQIFASQAGQIFQVAQMAEGGVKGFALEVSALALSFAPLIAVAAVAGVAVNRWMDGINASSGIKGYVNTLGLTAKETEKLKDVTVTTGDFVAGAWKTLNDGLGLTAKGKKLVDYLFGPNDAAQVAGFVAQIYGVFVGGYKGIVEVWQLLPAAIGDVVSRSAKATVLGIESMVNGAIDRVNALAKGANALIGMDLFGQIARVKIDTPGIDAAVANYAGAGAKAGAAFGKNVEIETKRAMGWMRGVAADVGRNSVGAAQARLDAQRDQIVKDRSPAGSKAISAEQRAYEAALKAAQDYIDAQDKQAAQIGKTAKEIRLLEDAAQRAKAPTEALRQEIDRAAAARETAYDEKAARDFDVNVMKPLRDELALHGLVGPARAAAALELEKEAFLIQHKDDGLVVALERWEAYYAGRRKLIEQDMAAEKQAADQRELAAALAVTADQWDLIARNVSNAADGMADAFGRVGRAIGEVASIYAGYRAEQEREAVIHERNYKAADGAAAKELENRRYALATATQQIAAYGDMAVAARGFFRENSDGYKALTTAVQVFRAIEFALSIKAMVQDAAATAASIAKSAARAVAHGVEAVAKAIASLPFPANIAAGAATIAALAAIGVSIVGGIGGGGKLPEANEGRGTVLGDPDAQSESLRRGIDALKEVDTLMLTSSRQMAGYLRSIDNQIGGFAAQIVRSGNVDASAGVSEGFKKDVIGSVLGSIPVIGGLLGGLFGTKTSVVGSGLYGGAQTVGDIVTSGFDASTYSDITKTKKFLGVTTSKKTSTQFADADAGLENQFTLILRGFASAIGAAAGPLGEATDAVQARLNGFVIDIGRIDLQNLTGEQIQEKLEAIFGAAADGMAEAAFPGIARFQQAGEGMFETLVRVSSTVEAVTASFEMLGRGGIGVDASVALAGLFDNLSDLTSAQQDYFEAFYDEAEQAAARRAQLERALGSLGVAMPATLASFRALVEAQDLTSEAGRSTYAVLLQLAPAFADLQTSMGGAKSAADIAAERLDLERKLLELNGDEAAIRALDLAKLDASNRGLQQQIWAAEAAKEAAAKADELRKAWSSVGDSLQEEIRRIRGLETAQSPAGFASIMGQFNAVTAAARAGDMDAAKQLPALSRSLLDAAAKAATSRQELDRVQADAAASLEATYAAIAGLGTSDGVADSATRTAEAMAQASAAATSTASATADMVSEFRQMREELTALRTENRDGHARTAGHAARGANVLETVAEATGGDAFAVASAA